jgi:error-prone DNA polymerase
MMAVLEDSIKLIRDHYKEEVDLAKLPADDPTVYDALQKADTVGMFQIESRAQMSCLPRLHPMHFYDIVVQVAIIRPGPIVGQMVNPYLMRRQGRQAVVYPHPSLEPVLERTLGVPLFQEQLLRVAMITAGFSGGEAEELRRAFGFKRSERRMRDIEVKLREGMTRNGIPPAAQQEIIQSITSFALYGFPESHAASFALIAYASAWLKTHYLAAFTAALLNNQPMGFYHPFTLVKDAQRHGVSFRTVDVTRSGWDCALEENDVRLGLRYVTGLRQEAGEAIVATRSMAPFADLQDFVDRARPRHDELQRLAEVGALNVFGLTRRSALWQVERAGRPRGPLLKQADVADDAPSPLPEMTLPERLSTDILGTSLTVGPHPMILYRDSLRARGVHRAAELAALPDGARVKVAGAVTCRQRPGTAKGFLFLTLEDETGLANITVRPDLFARRKTVLVESGVLEIDGILQNLEGTSVRALEVRPLSITPVPESRDFH